MNNGLNQYINTQVLPLMEAIAPARKQLLDEVVGTIERLIAEAGDVALTFICTHNSRRSQLAQVWAYAAVAYYNHQGLPCYSGGTEVTAFHPNAVGAVRRAGFEVSAGEGSINPRYMVSMNGEPGLVCYSKLYDDAANPSNGFLALMTCAEAEANCPFVAGAYARISLNFEDPKVWDNTTKAAERYEERSLQIASEMFYVFKQLSQNEQ